MLLHAVLAAGLVFEIAADRTNALYRCGETARLTVAAKTEDGRLATNGLVTAVLDNFGPERILRRDVDLAAGNPFTVEGALARPGFLRLRMTAEGSTARYWSVGYEPEKIKKGSSSPEDFDAFWAAARARLDAEVPLDPKVERVDAQSSKDWDFYRISFATHRRRIYGYMSVPTDRTKAPFAVRVTVPGAGYGAWSNRMSGSADHISVFLSVLPFEPSFDCDSPEKRARFEDLTKQCKEKYGCLYQQAGISVSREDYFYYPVIIGMNRAVDWVASRPDVDANRFVYTGVSQGGGFGFYLCALNRNFTRAALFVPALTDILGEKQGRQTGWPLLVENQRPEVRAEAERNAPYFDAANFAARIRCPVRVAVGFSDRTCPPSAVYAAYNEIRAPKEIVNGIGMTHSPYPWIRDAFDRWLLGETAQTTGELTREARNVVENLLSFATERPRRYVVSWTHPWTEYGSACARRDATGRWSPKPLRDIELDGYVRNLTGVDPILYFTDFYCGLGTWLGQDEYARNLANMEGFIKKAYDNWRSVPVFSWHLGNPYSPHQNDLPPLARGEDYRYRHSCEGYPQEHKHVIREILEGTGTICGMGRANAKNAGDLPPFTNPRAWYDWHLDRIAEFLKRLTDRDGRPIPVVVRLFHECEDDWQWWGSGSVSRDDYVGIFRYTVSEIRRRTGLRSLMFMYSPDCYWETCANPESRADFLYRYPGDAFVDLIGFDDYTVGGVPKNWSGDKASGIVASMNETIRKARIVSAFSTARGKPAGIVETSAGGPCDAITGLKSELSHGYGILREIMNAEGVSFAFFNTWGGSYTVPRTDAGKSAWREFLRIPEALTAGKGVDLTEDQY